MMHLSYEQEITLIKRLLMAVNVSESDAESLATVVTHSDFTGTYSHGLSRLCIYLRQYMKGALNPQPDFRLVKDKDAALVFECDDGSGIVAVNRVYDAVSNAPASMALPQVWLATARTSASEPTTAAAWQMTM